MLTRPRLGPAPNGPVTGPSPSQAAAGAAMVIGGCARSHLQHSLELLLLWACVVVWGVYGNSRVCVCVCDAERCVGSFILCLHCLESWVRHAGPHVLKRPPGALCVATSEPGSLAPPRASGPRRHKYCGSRRGGTAGVDRRALSRPRVVTVWQQHPGRC
jgi:hypothetical protein